jgi:hypothetical protein
LGIAPRSGEASPLRVCVLVAKSRAVSKDRLTVLQRTLEEQIDRSFEDALVPSVDCLAAGESLDLPTYRWFKPKALREIGHSAEVDVIITVAYRVEYEPVHIVAFDTQNGDVIGAKKVRWGQIRGAAKSVMLWLARQEATLE